MPARISSAAVNERGSRQAAARGCSLRAHGGRTEPIREPALHLALENALNRIAPAVGDITLARILAGVRRMTEDNVHIPHRGCSHAWRRSSNVPLKIDPSSRSSRHARPQGCGIRVATAPSDQARASFPSVDAHTYRAQGRNTTVDRAGGTDTGERTSSRCLPSSWLARFLQGVCLRFI